MVVINQHATLTFSGDQNPDNKGTLRRAYITEKLSCQHPVLQGVVEVKQTRVAAREDTTHLPVAAMGKCAPVALLLLALCWGAASDETPAEMDKDLDVCAMTDVLVAMKKLLILLSTEVRDLRAQVKNSCQASGTPDATATACPATAVESDPTEEPPSSQEATDTPAYTTNAPDDLESAFILDVDDDYDVDYEYGEPEENPVSGVAEGVADWWNNFSLFPPEPTTDASPTEQPDDGADEDYGQEEDTDEDDNDLVTKPTKAPSSATTTIPTTTSTTTIPTTTSTTTTTTTPLPHTLPPPPTSCPQPFTLLAEGCFLVVHNTRDWRPWGDADAFCQGYSGKLAAPWRLPQLQSYLSRYYSDAFWVGARLIASKGSWEWMTGRKVEKGEWKPGQPNRNPGKKCVFLDKWSGYRGNNYFCGEKLPFICESSQI
ncbi:Low affinity immunoglobulin epsilon Fc receptor [Chionoecetes opilio]|uniref:Low affinity immunoglobulin epsilon Fc receptor n=1 Tax=Chionoecetes opilio TaxID=41210 RepID=A0A8J4Y2I6_CHIOP|nr:Low affinity immunoglobulin epsilon Fc receptor [Chionoecetes opilio]